uniref:T9SS type A sorting domain-containing protein n=1 Tax=candidate division WOR-3 bacterium TaxID=2052148 RepID=A0A7C4XM48_UNCW3
MFVIITLLISWVVTENPSSSGDLAYQIVVQGDYLYIAGYDLVPGNLEWRIEKRNISDGSLVWFQTSNPSPYTDIAYALAVDANYIYVVGTDNTSDGLGTKWRIEKRNISDGSIVGAPVVEGVGGGEPYSITADANYIYIAGMDYLVGNEEWRIEKRNKSDLSLVWFQTSNPTNSTLDWDEAYSITCDATYLYIVGRAGVSPYVWRIEKRNISDGALVWAQPLPSSYYSEAHSVVNDADYLYIAGWDNASGDAQWRIEKRDKSLGNLIAGWPVYSNPGTSGDEALSITLDDNYLYIAGYQCLNTDYMWRIEKRNKSNGALVWTQISDPPGSSAYAYSITNDADSLYIAGFDNSPGTYDAQWRIEQRKKSNGNIGVVEEEFQLSVPTQPLKVNPNPFSEKLMIKFQPSSLGACRKFVVSIKIYDANGRFLRQWDYETIRLSNQIIWDGTDDFGRRLPAGIYFVRLESNEFKRIEKVVLLR